MKEKFIKFLHSEKVYDKFIKNLSKFFTFEEYMKLESYNDEIYEKLIISGFVWEYSKEGYNFWDNINTKWYNLISKNIVN